jgi:osmotically inducible lipoprotein OsmB
MNTLKRYTVSMLAIVLLASLSGCANMSSRQKDSAIGAGVGAAAGALITGGWIGTAVGAGAGAVVGHEVGK